MLKVSIVTPTFFRHIELPDYFKSIEFQTHKPFEIILVDGAPLSENRSESLINEYINAKNLNIKYYRHQGGTAIQRNYGIDKAKGDLILFMDDDVRLSPNFIENIKYYFDSDGEQKIGGITGYRTNKYFDFSKNQRWKWYKKLRLLNEFTPGKYDFETGYPINNNGQKPFSGIREVDFMTTACTMYRSSILKNEVKFDGFFIGYGILEDTHLSLNIKKRGYQLYQCGDAHCVELSAASGRSSKDIIGERTVINYYYVFKSIAGPLSFNQKKRFFMYQFFELFRAFTDILRFRQKNNLLYVKGKIIGIYKAICNKV